MLVSPYITTNHIRPCVVSAFCSRINKLDCAFYRNFILINLSLSITQQSMAVSNQLYQQQQQPIFEPHLNTHAKLLSIKINLFRAAYNVIGARLVSILTLSVATIMYSRQNNNKRTQKSVEAIWWSVAKTINLVFRC